MPSAPFEDSGDEDYRTADEDSDDGKTSGTLRGQVGRNVGQVMIDGNARVHLGDMIVLDSKAQNAKSISQQQCLLGIMDIIPKLVDFAMYVTILTGQDSDISQTISHIVEADHALIAASLSNLKGHIASLDTCYTAFCVQPKSLPKATTESFKAIFEIVDSIIASTVRRAISLAFSIESCLLDLQSRVANPLTQVHGFIEAWNNKGDSDALTGTLSEISGIKADLQTGTILLLSCPTIIEVLKSRSPKHSGKTITDILLRAGKETLKLQQELSKKITADSGREIDVRVEIATKWLEGRNHRFEAFMREIYITELNVWMGSARKQILGSLAFSEMHARYSQVTRAEAETFGWIYETDTVTEQASFATWIQDRHPACPGLYWISGKPGSGKSTLLKFLTDDDRTTALAQKWAKKSDLLVIKSFFWNAGTRQQKSQEGMLQSLLYQLLITWPEFDLQLLPYRSTYLRLEPQHDLPWSTRELYASILAFIRNQGTNKRILLIIDGLDEYEPEHKVNDTEERQKVCDFLVLLAGELQVKVCASSRPWNVYRAAFRAYPFLRLEDLTRNDIRRYIEQKFETNYDYCEWYKRNPTESNLFLKTFIDRAQGVFLWVHLVTKSLLQGLQNLDGPEDLHKRLEQIPNDLETYFTHIISSIDTFYLQQAAHIFHLALSGPHHLLMLYHFMLKPSTDGQLASMGHLTMSQIRRLQESEEIRLNARCVGFLETHDARNVDKSFSEGLLAVDFLHRTARDFMLTENMQKTLWEWRGSHQDRMCENLKAFHSILATCSVQDPWVCGRPVEPPTCYRLLRECALDMCWAAQQDDLHIWHELDRLEADCHRLPHPDTKVKLVLLSQAIAMHHPYAQYTLQEWKSAERLSKRERSSWLHEQCITALRGDGKPFEIGNNHFGIPWNDTGLAILARLFELGTSPNNIYNDQTLWEIFLSDVDFNGHTLRYKPDIRVARLLVQHGARNPRGVKNSVKDMNQPKLDKLGPSPTPNLYQVLLKLCPPSEVRELCSLIQQNDQKCVADGQVVQGPKKGGLFAKFRLLR